jgi:hypothetical protein
MSHPRALRQPAVLGEQVTADPAAGRRKEQRHVHEVPTSRSGPQRNDSLRPDSSLGGDRLHQLRSSGHDVTISLQLADD